MHAVIGQFKFIINSSIKQAVYVMRMLYRVIMDAAFVGSLNIHVRYFLSIFYKK